MTYLRRLAVPAVLAGIVAPSALAAGPPAQPAPSVSAIWQYVEQVPSSTGPKVASTSGPPRTAALPKRIESRVRKQGGTDAAALNTLATDPGLGAPEPPARAPKAPAHRKQPATEKQPAREKHFPTLPPTPIAAAPGPGGAPYVLLAGVAAITLSGAAAWAVGRARS